MSDDIVYTADIRIDRLKGPYRHAYIPAHDGPVEFGVHGAIKEHYGADPEREISTTLDYVMAATGGWLTGTFGGALEARGIKASEGKLSGFVRGEVGKEDNVLVIRRVHVRYALKADEADRETIERVHDVHRDFCPVYRTLKSAIEITTEFELVE